MELSNYTTFDEPVPYKKLKIYPATVKDYLLFSLYSICLTIDKNSIPDPEIIRMTELEYMFYSSILAGTKEGFAIPYLYYFDKLLGLVLKKDTFENEEESFDDIEKSIKRYEFNENGKPVFRIDNEIYNSEDFDNIKLIIAEQNLVELIDESISKEVRDSLEEARRYKKKLAGEKTATFEEYLISLSIATGWTLDYIYSLSVRKFIKSVERLDNLIHYKIFLAASMSGMVEFKDKSFIKHWLTSLEDKDKYKDVSLDLEALQSKISLESAKK